MGRYYCIMGLLHIELCGSQETKYQLHESNTKITCYMLRNVEATEMSHLYIL